MQSGMQKGLKKIGNAMGLFIYFFFSGAAVANLVCIVCMTSV